MMKLFKIAFLPLLAGILLLPAASRPVEAGAGDRKRDKKKKQEADTAAKATPYEKLFKDKRVETVRGGGLTLHLTADKLYLELPDSLLGRGLMITTTIEWTGDPGDGLAHQQPVPPYMVEFGRGKSDTLLCMREFAPVVIVDGSPAMREAVGRSNIGPIVASYAVKARTPDGKSSVVDVTALFVGDVKRLRPIDPEGGNTYGDATSTSAKALFPAEDYVCGQCHAMFPGAAYLEDANKGIDQYKYGFEPEEMLRAMKEYYEANPVTETTICAGMVGVPMLDPEIDTVLYLTDACTEVELFQDSNHQKMGLTCTDCHMPQIEASGGTTYTYHNMTQSPLENPAALEKCLTCHKSQGIEDADAMVAFVKGKMDELAQIQQATKTKLDEFHAKLADAVAAGNADEAKLQAAKDAYNLANVYFLYQGTAMRPTDGSMAAMSFSKSVEQLQKADDAIAEGMSQIA